jgi:flagellin
MQINGNNPIINNDVYLNANQALNRIATGIEINQASDDASSLAIADNLLAQSNGYSQAIENTNSAIAASQITDGALNSQSNILDDIKQKLTQAATDTTSDEGREAILKDIQGQLKAFDNIAQSTNYNGQNLLQASSEDSSASSDLQYQSGIEGQDLIEQSGIQSNTEGLGLSDLLNQDISSFSSADARAYLEDIDNAIDGLNDFRGEVGSTVNQLQSANNTLLTQEASTLQAASVFNTDYAAESANFSKQNILSQIGAFVQAQGNPNQDVVTRLLS